MSVYREDKPLDDEDRFTYEDARIIKKLLAAKKLTERQKLALRRLFRNYNHMID